MIAIAPHHAFYRAQMIVIDSHQAVFVDHEHADAVRDVQQRRSGGRVRSAIGVHAHALEQAQAVLDQGVGRRGTHARVIFVVVAALQLQVLAVEKETPTRIEAYAAHAKHRSVLIEQLSCIVFEAGDQSMEIGFSHRPERRVLQVQRVMHRLPQPGE